MILWFAVRELRKHGLNGTSLSKSRLQFCAWSECWQIIGQKRWIYRSQASGQRFNIFLKDSNLEQRVGLVLFCFNLQIISNWVTGSLRDKLRIKAIEQIGKGIGIWELYFSSHKGKFLQLLGNRSSKQVCNRQCIMDSSIVEKIGECGAGCKSNRKIISYYLGRKEEGLHFTV